MAQERVRRVASRYGAGARVAVLAALACLLVVLSVAGMALAGGGGGVTVERAGRGEALPVEDGVRDEGDAEAEVDEVAEASTVVVHVDGAVVSAGVYELAEGARVADAVESAGGLVEGADTTSLNLAAPLSDGEKVHVPVVGEDVEETGTATSGAAPSVVNINTAGVEELDVLPGVGEATARAIVEDRETNGPFSTPEDLMRVSGIGEKKFAKLEGLIRV